MIEILLRHDLQKLMGTVFEGWFILNEFIAVPLIAAVGYELVSQLKSENETPEPILLIILAYALIFDPSTGLIAAILFHLIESFYYKIIKFKWFELRLKNLRLLETISEHKEVREKIRLVSNETKKIKKEIQKLKDVKSKVTTRTHIKMKDIAKYL